MILHEAPLNPKTHTERLAQIHFESFGTPSLLMSPPSGYLSLLYSGRTTGIGFDSGAEITSVVGVLDGLTIPSSLKRYDFGGRDITMTTLIRMNQNARPSSDENKHNVRMRLDPTSWQHRYIVDGIKAKHAYVREDNTKRKEKSKTVHFKLPDGTSYETDSQFFDVTEAYFDANKSCTAFTTRSKCEMPSIVHLIRHAATCVENNIARDLMLNNVCISGGSVQACGFASRLESELGKNIIQSDRLACSTVFGGASLLYELRAFRLQFVSRKSYEEFGTYPSLTHSTHSFHLHTTHPVSLSLKSYTFTHNYDAT